MALHLSLDKIFVQSTVDNVNETVTRYLESHDPLQTDLILSYWEEPFQEDLFKKTIKIILEKNYKNVTLLADPFELSMLKDKLSNFGLSKSLDINGLLLFTCETHSQTPNVKWNRLANKGLLLTGRLDKLSRIGLLKALYNKDLLDNQKIFWTFPDYHQQKKNIERYIHASIEDNLLTFFNHCQSNRIDIKTLPTKFFSHWHTNNSDDRHLFNNIYGKTSYSIISESYHTEYPWFTEKTYRTILYKHPFILVGPTNSLKSLQSIGFRTFNNYFPDPNYDSIINPVKRMKAIVENISFFAKIIEEHGNDIEQDVEFNYQHLLNLYNLERDKISSLYKKLGLPFHEWRQNFGLYSAAGTGLFQDIKSPRQMCPSKCIESKLYIERYNKCKGAAWPDITNLLDGLELSDWILDELDYYKIEFPFI